MKEMMVPTFVLGPWVIVTRPGKFFVYPREQADGRVRETVPERLRFGGLDSEVARASLARPEQAVDHILETFVERHREELDKLKGGGEERGLTVPAPGGTPCVSHGQQSRGGRRRTEACWSAMP